MDGGGSIQSNERAAEKLMDDHLKSIGLHRKKIAKDGSCLFRAVAEQVLHCQSHHTVVRAKCVEFLKENRELYEAFIEGDFEEYLSKLQDPQQWVGEVEINALAIMYKYAFKIGIHQSKFERDFLIFQEPGKPAVNITDNNFKDKVQLCFLNGNHYDSVYPISRIRSAGVCQSILYELLYDRVFKVDQSLLGLCQRVPRSTDALSDDNMGFCGSSEESDLDTGEAIWVESETTTTKHSKGRGRRGPQLPERVRRSLNPTLYRNIEYDVWHKTKRAQQKMDYCIAAGMQFAAGDQCQVRLDGSGRSYTATVKEVPPDNGPVTVLIEELGRKQVPLWNLRPASDESSWRTVGGRDKKLSNGHGEWEERGKGRGRGKHIPGSSSASQLAAGGSSGRGQKQNFWPSQSPKEEQGGGKSSRRPMSSVEPAFGLTEEQRSAREEEELNAALVEIQLRDENSFPALGSQSRSQNEASRRKGGEKLKFPRNKMSPVEDNRVPSPSEGKNPKSSTPPLADTPAATTAVNTNAAPSSPSVPAAQCPAPADPAAPEPPLTSASTVAKTKPLSNVKAAASSLPPAATQGVTPPVPGGAAPTTPRLSTCSPPSPLPLKISSSPSPSSVPAPTFFAPVAPSPTAAHGFLPPASLPRCSPTPPSLQHPLSPHPSSSSSVQTTPSSSVVRHVARVPEAAPVAAQSPNVGAAPDASQTTQTQAAKPEFCPQGPVRSLVETCSQAVVPQDQPLPPQTQSSVRESHLPHKQQEPRSNPEVDAAPQIPPPVAGQAPATPSQPDVAQVQDFHSASDDVCPPAQLHQPPHPSQVPPPSFPLPDAPDDPHSQNSSAQTQAEESLPPTQPQPESPTPPALQPQQPHTSLHPHLPTVLPHFQSIPGSVPLHQLSQLYQDPLYPGFPQGDKGGVAATPPYSSNKSGDDMPQDINILRFFFNLGIKAYSMPMFAPYIYLLPLQHAHTLQAHSQSPTPNYPPSSPPARPQELYPPPQYPPAPSMPPQYDQPADTESSQAGEVYNQPTYPVTDAPPQRTSGPTHAWEQHQIPPPTSSSFTIGYPTPNQPYSHPRHFPQGYHPVPGLQQYPPGAPPYAPSSLGYQSPPAREELQVNQGAPEQQQQQQQQQSTNGDPSPHVHGTIAAKRANISSSRTMVLPGYPVKIETRENLTRAVLLVDPPLNNNPILVSNSGVKDVPISRTTINPNSTPGSPLSYDIISKTPVLADNNLSHGYRAHQKMLGPANTYSSPGTSETGQVGYLASMAEPMSVGCSTEEDWEEKDFKPTPSHYRGPRRTFRSGGRWRGSHDSGRGTNRRRQAGDAGVGMNYFHYNPSARGRGRERD